MDALTIQISSKKAKALEILTANIEGYYNISYEYSEDGKRLLKETITGDIERITIYTYDGPDIIKEVIFKRNKIITKIYTYDNLHHMTNVAVTTVTKSLV